MAFNAELGTKIRDFIVTNPKRHWQKDWTEENPEECGTTACLAGWACIIGMELPLRQSDPRRWDAETGTWVPYPGNFFWREPAGGWGDNATTLLGISQDMADALFLRTDNETALDALTMLIDGEDEWDVIRFIDRDDDDDDDHECDCGCEDE